MDVSVVVCTYNRAGSLRLTLEALEAQAIPSGIEWELLVVDNNSTDDTRSVVEAFATASRVLVRYVFVAEQGLSHARNVGLGHAKGHIVAFTDDDVRPATHWVASVTEAMRESSVAIVGGRILPAWDRRPPPWLEHDRALRYDLALMEHGAPAEIWDPSGLPAVWGANMAFRREVFERAGLFDPRHGVSGTKLYRGEEVDLVRRALAMGYRVAYDPRVLVRHRIPADRMRLRYFSRFYFQRAEGEALAEDVGGGRRLFGAPLYSYRTMARRLRACAWAAARGRPEARHRWLESCETAGSIWGLWKRHFRGAR